jgi:hypothetical protein
MDGVVRCGPVTRGPDVAPSGHEVGRRVQSFSSAEMLRRWCSSGHLPTDRCCPWGTAGCRCHRHAKSLAGEDQPGSGAAAMAIT